MIEIDDDVTDIDIAIGNINYIGRNIASRALRQLIETTLLNNSTPIIMATSIKNSMAQRAFEKAGFKKLRHFDDQEYGTMLLYVLG